MFSDIPHSIDVDDGLFAQELVPGGVAPTPVEP